MSLSQIPTLAVLIKRPSYRRGLPPLSAEIGPATTLDIAEHLLACALEDAREFPGRVVLIPSREQDEPWAQTLLDNVEVMVSAGKGRSHMLGPVDSALRELGHQKIVFMDTSTPLLDQRDYIEMIARLGRSDVAIRADRQNRLLLFASRIELPVDKSFTWETPSSAGELSRYCQSEGLDVFQTNCDDRLDAGCDLYTLSYALRNQHRPARQALSKYLRMRFRAPASVSNGHSA